MKAGEKERVGALRLRAVRAAEGRQGGRRRRGRGAAPRAQAPPRGRRAVPRRRARRAGRQGGGRGRADRRLPPGRARPTTSCAAIVAEAVERDRRRARPRTWARSMGAGDARGRRARRRQAGLGAGAGGAAVRRQIELPNDVAAELAGSEDAVLQGARGPPRLRASSCAATSLTLDGPEEAVERRRAGRARARRPDRRRATRSPRARSSAVTSALDQHESPGARSSRTSSGATATMRVAPKTRQPEALRRLDPPQHDHLRHRPGGHGQDVPGRRDGGGGAVASARSTASSSPVPRSRPASGWASCPAT